MPGRISLIISWQPFGSIPVFLALGNHELIPPKTRDQALLQFADWFDAPEIREQRLRDDPHDHAVRAYYHWMKDGIDFITLDNASPDEFDVGANEVDTGCSEA